jgi:hypothetical protein
MKTMPNTMRRYETQSPERYEMVLEKVQRVDVPVWPASLKFMAGVLVGCLTTWIQVIAICHIFLRL